jgi:hypothetical protein
MVGQNIYILLNKTRPAKHAAHIEDLSGLSELETSGGGSLEGKMFCPCGRDAQPQLGACSDVTLRQLREHELRVCLTAKDTSFSTRRA